MITINAQNLRCPLPLLKAKKALHNLKKGQRLQISATDPGSWRDFQVFCEHSHHKLIARNLENGVYTYIIEKG